MLAAVFAMQGLGILAQGIVTLLALLAFKSSIEHDTANLDYVWRISLGLGTLPGCIALVSRTHMPETPRYTLEIDNDYERAAVDVDYVLDGKRRELNSVQRRGENRPTIKEIFSHFTKLNQFKVLIGTCVPRFALNVAFYGINLNSGIILQSIGFGESKEVYTTILNNTIGQIIIALLGSIPGYWSPIQFGLTSSRDIILSTF